MEATGSYYAVGIGTSDSYSGRPSSCGTITITSGISVVKATNGSGANGAIGKATQLNSQCTGVYFGEEQMYDGTKWKNGHTTTPDAGSFGGLNFSITGISGTIKQWTLTPVTQ